MKISSLKLIVFLFLIQIIAISKIIASDHVRNSTINDPEWEGLCSTSLGMSVNGQEVQPADICPGTWVKITWNRGFGCANGDDNTGKDRNFVNDANVWSVKGVTDVFRGPNGTWPSNTPPFDPFLYLSINNTSVWTSFSGLIKDQSEIYVKFAHSSNVNIHVIGNQCGSSGLCGIRQSQLDFSLRFNNSNVSIIGDNNFGIPCNSGDLEYTFDGINLLNNAVQVNVIWQLLPSNSGWSFIGGNTGPTVTINNNGFGGEPLLTATATINNPGDCNYDMVQKSIGFTRDLSSLAQPSGFVFQNGTGANGVELCENSQNIVQIPSNGNPNFTSYTWEVFSNTGNPTVTLNLTNPPAGGSSLTSANADFVEINTNMSDDLSWRARYEYTCGSGPWKNSTSYNTTQLPDRPEGIEHMLVNSDPICHNKSPRFRVLNPIPGLSYTWSTVPSNSVRTPTLNTDEVTVSALQWASHQDFLLIVSAGNLCGPGLSKAESFPINQDPDVPEFDVPGCWKYANSSDPRPNILTLTNNANGGFLYDWTFVATKNNNAVPQNRNGDETRVFTVGFTGDTPDDIDITMSVEGCNFTRSATENDPDPTFIPMDAECEGGGPIPDKRGDFNVTSDLSVYPNPTNEVLNILNATDVIASLSITSIAGEAVFSAELKPGKNIISVEAFPKGIYIAKTEYGGEVQIQKILIE